LLRIGQRGKAGNDDDTQFLDRPTSCYHNTETREVFVSDGYGNHRIIAFNADTGAFTRMWGAFGKKASSLSAEEGFANPVHKVAAGPDGHIYVCDRIKNRIQEFELIPGGARYLREVTIAPGTTIFGATFDMAFAPDGKFIYVADGSNNRVWTLDRESFAVLGWISADTEKEGESNLPRQYEGLLHRFRMMPNGDLLLACVTRGIKRLKFLGVS
jgi:DNA-binding beta-propeller fold protein YncE